jgi:hypothetical protein
MTPEERQAYKAWQRSHKPGRPVDRAAERVRRRQSNEAREMLADEPRPVSEEAKKLERRAAELREELARLRIGQGEGIFG